MAEYDSRKVPLMQSPLFAKNQSFGATYQRRKSQEIRTTVRQKEEPSAHQSGWGISLGTIGQKTNAQADALSLNLLWGGRLQFYFPLSNKLALQPSVGFFTKRSGTEFVGVNQHNFEAGATLQWVPSASAKVRWMGGLAQRFEAILASTSVGNASNAAPLTYRYRIGPSMGISAKIGNALRLVTELEVTLPVNDVKRPYGGFTAGLLFE